MLCPGLSRLGIEEKESCLSAHWFSQPRYPLALGHVLEMSSRSLVSLRGPRTAQPSAGDVCHLLGSSAARVHLHSKSNSVFWGMRLSGPAGLEFCNDKALGLGWSKEISWPIGWSLEFLRWAWVPL